MLRKKARALCVLQRLNGNRRDTDQGDLFVDAGNLVHGLGHPAGRFAKTSHQFLRENVQDCDLFTQSITAGLSIARIGVLAALYPAVWGVGQLVTGAASDRYGRKVFIVAGMLLQAAALAGVALAGSFAGWATALVLLGAGTAMVYPTLLAAVADIAHPFWRARAVGVYRLWRDAGFAVGAVLSGIVADAWGIRPAVWTVAALTGASGVLVLARMGETAFLNRRPGNRDRGISPG